MHTQLASRSLKPAAPGTPHPAGHTHPDTLSACVAGISRWLAFLAGVALFVAVALIPPATDLEHIRDARDQTLAAERHDLRRLDAYRAMRDALVARDPETVRLVLASELQLVPGNATALVEPGTPEDPRLFELLEPELTAAHTQAAREPSTLTRLATDKTGRLALLILAAAAALWGCLPPTAPRDARLH